MLRLMGKPSTSLLRTPSLTVLPLSVRGDVEERVCPVAREMTSSVLVGRVIDQNRTPNLPLMISILVPVEGVELVEDVGPASEAAQLEVNDQGKAEGLIPEAVNDDCDWRPASWQFISSTESIVQFVYHARVSVSRCWRCIPTSLYQYFMGASLPNPQPTLLSLSLQQRT